MPKSNSDVGHLGFVYFQGLSSLESLCISYIFLNYLRSVQSFSLEFINIRNRNKTTRINLKLMQIT